MFNQNPVNTAVTVTPNQTPSTELASAQTALHGQIRALPEAVQVELLAALRECKDAHEVTGLMLALVGADNFTAYQSVPKLNARTVRYATGSDAFHKYTEEINTKESCEDMPHKESTENAVLDEVKNLAEKARVKVGQAVNAVTRYLNKPERVKQVLSDLVELQTHDKNAVYNPTGLFTRLMRSGESVRLPDSLIQKREHAEQQAAAQAKKVVPVVGMLVKAFGEVCRIVELTANFATVETQHGLCNIHRDSLRPA